jgi:predicted chitinase
MAGDLSKLNRYERIVYDQLKKDGYTDIAAAAVMGVCGGESAYTTFKEDSYYSTGADRIQNIFSAFQGMSIEKINSYRGGKLAGVVNRDNPSKEQLQFDKFFFDKVYGGQAETPQDEGYKYYGRGFNGLTFKGNYRKYGNKAGINILDNPELMENPEIVEKYGCSVPAKILSAYFDDIKSMNTSLEETFRLAYRYNAGPGNSWEVYRTSGNSVHVGGIPKKRGKGRYYYEIITGEKPPPLGESENAVFFEQPLPGGRSSAGGSGSGGGGAGGDGTGRGSNSRAPRRRRSGAVDSSPPEVRNIVESKKKAKKISFEIPPDPEVKKQIVTNFGKIPILWYNSYQIQTEDIKYLCLYSENSVPTLKATFRDTMNMMKDIGFPLDDTRITIFINTLSEQLKPIHLDFKITKFINNSYDYTVVGTLDVSDLYVKKFMTIPKSTSFEALQKIVEEIGIGYNSNIENSDDEMNWINSGKRMIDFINLISDRSYKSDEAFLVSFVDYYYNLNLIDIEKELSRDIKKELGMSNIGLETAVGLQKKENISKLLLTTDKGFRTSNSFVESYRIINNSTSVSIREGYLTKINYYDSVNKEFMVFDVDSLTSKDDKIIMKGSPQDESFFSNNVNLVYTGKLDDDNAHKNYQYAFIQNLRNIVELQKVGLELILSNPNYNLKRFQKILFILSSEASTPSASQVNNRLSGEWLIIDISYRIEDFKYRQIVKIVKRELELSEEEKKLERRQLKRGSAEGKTYESNPVPDTQSGESSEEEETTEAGSDEPIILPTVDGIENLMGSESPDSRFEFGLSTQGLKGIFVAQGLPNNCDAASRLVVYRYFDKKRRGKINNPELKTKIKTPERMTDLNPQVEMGGYEVSWLYGGKNTWFSIATESKSNPDKWVGGSDWKKGLAYLDACLKNGVPVIVGVGIPRYSSGNIDTSDHFIVMVGKGKGGEYYYLDVAGLGGGNPSTNVFTPVQGKPYLYKSPMAWSAGYGTGSGIVYLTMVCVYPKDVKYVDKL